MAVDKSVKAGTVGELSPGQLKVVDFNGERILLINTSGKYYAVGEACPHAGAPLSEGFLEDASIECPFHGSSFDVTTGAVLTPPANESLPTYKVEIVGDEIWIGSW